MTPPFAEAPPAPAWRNGPWLKATVILLAGWFIYAPVFGGGWLMDYNLEVSANVVVQDPAGLPKIWRGESGADYLPLKTTVQWLLWRGFGGNPAPYHLTSIALHLASALLFWGLLARLGVRHAWIGGLLFVVHPIFVESVAWVSELKNTLSLTFLLVAMLCYRSFDAHRRPRAYAGAVVLFAAALLCKASVIMFPAVILLHAWWKHGRIDRRELAASLPFFVISLLVAVTTVWMQGRHAIRTEEYPLGGLASHAALAGMAVVFYLWKLILPVGLLPMYPRWNIHPPGAWDFLPWLALLGLGIWLWTKRSASWASTVCFGLGFFLLNLLPVLGFFKMSFMRISWVSDHFVYVSALGVIGLAVAGCGVLQARFVGKTGTCLRAAGWLAVGVLTLASRWHAEVYSGLEPYSRYTIQHNPDAWLAHQLSAAAAQRRGDFRTALVQATEAVRLHPGVAETQNSLGMALDANGRPQEGAVHLREAQRIAPHNWAIRENLANCLARGGTYAQALPEYRALLQHAPADAVLHGNTGACLLGLGQFDEAIDEFHRALALHPALRGVSENLALAIRQREQRSKAPVPPE